MPTNLPGLMGEKRTIENTSAVILTLFGQYFVDLEFWFGEFSKIPHRSCLYLGILIWKLVRSTLGMKWLLRFEHWPCLWLILFQIEDWTTMEDLNTTVQESKEGLVDYVKHFRNVALDCYESKSRKEIVRICICNTVNSQWVFLGNHDIMLFSLLLENN